MLYETAALFVRHSGGWILHQLRHSSLTHLAEGGASAVTLQAKSRHRDLRTLSVYIRPATTRRGPRPVPRLEWGYPPRVTVMAPLTMSDISVTTVRGLPVNPSYRYLTAADLPPLMVVPDPRGSYRYRCCSS